MSHEIRNLRPTIITDDGFPLTREFVLGLSEEEFDFMLNKLSPDAQEELLFNWGVWGRPSQQMPAGDDWFVWMILAGRGWGKTRTAVENIARMVRGPSPLVAPPNAPKLISIIADNPSDMRQYTIEGPSGFANVGPPDFRPQHFPSVKTLVWPNGIKALLFSAEDPESLRGASGEFFWWDELAKSQYSEDGWSNMMFGMREGNPRGIVTTTPRPKTLLSDLIAKKSTITTRGSTLENEENLAEKFIEEVIKPQLETRIGRQEIFAELLFDTPGALWDRELLDRLRLKEDKVPALDQFKRIVVAIDPSGTKGDDVKSKNRRSMPKEKSNDVGIVVAGIDFDGKGYVLADRTCNLGPAQWAAKAVAAYKEFGADLIVAERNFGGAMVGATIRSADPDVPFKEVTASRGKVARAEPIASLYEQARVKHFPGLGALEDQMLQMTPDGFQGSGSPDRVDACVWALTELMLKKVHQQEYFYAPEIIHG